MPKAIFFSSLDEEINHKITQHAPAEFEVSVQPATLPDSEKIALAKDADFLILFPSTIPADVLRAAKRLKLIQLVSVGYDRMDLALCKELGLPIATNGGANAIDVAEHTLAFILAFYRRFQELDAAVKAGQWRGGIDTGLTSYTIRDKTVGIIGFGQIGRAVAQLLNAFGATVCYYDAYRASKEDEQLFDVTYKPLASLLGESDIVTLHVPLLPETRGLINQERLSLMKPSALLVNTCRGPIIEQAALVDALRQKQIGGAALDVFEQEPPQADNPLFEFKNVLLTPHTAGITYDTWNRRGEFIFQNLQRVWSGQSALATVHS